MTKVSCPSCGSSAVRPGASKCPACRAWIGAPPAEALSFGSLWARAATLLTVGAALGAVAVQLASASSVPWLDAFIGASAPATPPAAASAPPAPPSSASSALPSTSAAPSASATAPGAAAQEVRWGDPRTVKLGVSPLDVAVSDDGAAIFVLGQDNSVRAISAENGREERRVVLATRPSGIRLLGGRYLAVIGGGPFLVIDLSSWTGTKLDVGGSVVDAVMVGEGRTLIAASAEGGRVARFVPGKAGAWRLDGEVTLTRPPFRLSIATGERVLLAVLTQPGSSGDSGAVELLDPRDTPFGGVRIAFPATLDANAVAVPGRDRFAILDRGGSQLLRVAPSEPMQIARLGAAPRGGMLGAFRLLDKYLAVVDGSGAALVFSEPDGALVATLALGAEPSSAAVSPDGRALLVALGGGPRGRGAETVVVSGDPPAITARLDTGAGSLAVSVSASGRRAAVASFWNRTVAILDQR